MALSLTELQSMRDALIAAIGSGTLRVEFEGRSTSPRQVVITPKGI
jgi:hypothetical protein